MALTLGQSFMAGLVAATVALAAAPAAALDRTISLDEACRLAVENHERVAIAGEGVLRARADLDKAVSRVLPNLTAEASYTRYSEQKRSGGFLVQPESTTNAELRLTQPLYAGGKEWATQRQARLQIRSTKEALEGAAEGVILDASRAYYSVLKAARDVEISSSSLKRAGERLEVASARLKVGEVTRSAVLRAEAEKAGAEAELIRAESALVNARNLLARVTGLEGGVAVVEPEPLPPVTRSAAELVELAVERRSDYTRRRLEEKAASEGIQIAWAGFKPSVKLEGVYSWRDQDPQTTFFQESTASGTVRLTYPLFEGFLRKAEVSEARSRLREAELRRLGLRRDIEVQVREVLNSVAATEALAASFRRQLAFAEEDYRMVFEQFRFGVATTLDVIDAENTLVAAESSLAGAVYDHELAKIELKFVTGALADGYAQQGAW